MSSESKTAKVQEDLTQYSKPIIKAITTTTPIIINGCQKAWAFYKSLSVDYIQLIIGCVFCFFGGVFPALFAAIEAAKHGGISNVAEALGDLGDEAIKVIGKQEDDDVDEDNNGVKDVKEIEAKALLLRKAHLVMTKINPEKVDKALSSIFKVWMSVIAVLTLKFAQTISLSVSISKFLKKPTDRYITPLVKDAVPVEYSKWVPVLMGWITKSIGLRIAWSITTLLTAVTSALIGSLMMSRALLNIARSRGVSFDSMLSKDNNDTTLDENLSYLLSLIGIYFQFKIGFNVPFPLNIFLWPLALGEYFIRWSITKI
jgi:hypothetical protein